MKLLRDPVNIFTEAQRMEANPTFTDRLRIDMMETFLSEEGSPMRVVNCVSHTSNSWPGYNDKDFKLWNSVFDCTNKKSWFNAIYGNTYGSIPGETDTLRRFIGLLRMILWDYRHMPGTEGYGKLFEKLIYNEVLLVAAALLQEGGVIILPGKTTVYEALYSQTKDGKTTNLRRYKLNDI